MHSQPAWPALIGELPRTSSISVIATFLAQGLTIQFLLGSSLVNV